MRILHVTDNYAPASGGLERTVQVLAAELAARGHDVDVATLSRPDAIPHERDGAVTVHRLDGLTRHLRRFGTDPGHQFHPTAPDPLLVRRLQEVVDRIRPDIVHAHGWILHSCVRLRLPAGAALVTTLHDYSLVCPKKTMIHREELDARCAGASPRRCLPCANASYGVVKGTALTAGLFATRRGFDRVAMFLPISHAVAEACLPGVDPDRITVIPSFVADDVATPGQAPDFLPDGDFVLFVGALGEHKGVDLLAQAHRRMATDVPLVMIGPRRPDTPPLTGPNLIVRSGVPHPQIMAAFAAAAVVAIPSRWPEPLGLVTVEAMASGVPVVASRTGGLAELVRDGVTGRLVEPGDPTALARTLDDLLADPTARARMGAAAVEDARHYQASAVVPRVLAAYERALAA